MVGSVAIFDQMESLASGSSGFAPMDVEPPNKKLRLMSRYGFMKKPCAAKRLLPTIFEEVEAPPRKKQKPRWRLKNKKMDKAEAALANHGRDTCGEDVECVAKKRRISSDEDDTFLSEVTSKLAHMNAKSK